VSEVSDLSEMSEGLELLDVPAVSEVPDMLDMVKMSVASTKDPGPFRRAGSPSGNKPRFPVGSVGSVGSERKPVWSATMVWRNHWWKARVQYLSLSYCEE
jgi:hypothetical protein